jgi:flagellar biosynthesis/type III secretory pathway M-ring protein FliF/YscJ
VAGMGILMVVLRRRRKQRAKALAAELSALGSPDQLATAVASGRRARRKRGADKDPRPALATAAAAIDVAVDPDRAAVDDIRADLERMLHESPESLAALLSTWMAK